MRDQQVPGPDGTAAMATSERPGRPRSETIHVRSYDHQRAYDVHVELVDDDDTVFEERYYLLPGTTASEMDAVPRGTYELRVTLDNTSRETTDCHLDSSAEHTAVIEVGNGTVALTEGLVE